MEKSKVQAKPHQLLEYFADYLAKSIELIQSNPKFDINKNNYHLHSEASKFALSIFKYQMKLYELVSDLKKIEIFIRRFPTKKFYEENDIDQLAYIKYHYEVFIHKIHTILEVKKLAVNTIYDIGLSEKDCSWENLKNKKEIRNSDVSKIIEAYFKSFKHIIEHRHLNTHRAHFADTENDDLKGDYMIYQGAQRLGHEVGERFQRFMPESILKYRIKQYRTEKIAHIKNGIEVAEKYFEQFEMVMLSEFFRIVKNE